jgi:ubiquinone/menaquinone biosynthesis C-methylase UbiE
MKGDWNRRAQEDARYFIAPTQSTSQNAFDATGGWEADLFFEDVSDLLTPETVLLDIGCGIGRMDRCLAPRVGRLIAFDVSGEMLARARDYMAGITNTEFVEGNGFDLRPISDGTVDVIYSHSVFLHLPREAVESYIADSNRVLRQGGSLLFSVPEFIGSPPADPPPSDTFSQRFYGENGIRAMVERHGFRWRGCRRKRIGTTEAHIEQIRTHAAKEPRE